MQGLVTVFGGSGFVGSQVVRQLAKRGHRVRVAVRRPGLAYRLRLLGDVGQIEIVQANIRDDESVARSLYEAEAAVLSVGVLWQHGRQTFEAIQAEGAERVAKAAAAEGIARLVHISAIGADPASPAAYARSKAAGEAAVRQALPGAVIVRPSVVFGPEDDFFNRFAAMAARGPVLPLIGGGKTRLQPVFVADVAAAVATALEDPATAGQTFELGGPGVYSFEDLMKLVLLATGRKRPLAAVPAGFAALLGRLGDAIGSLGLVAPPITSDQVKMLAADNVVAPGARGLADLGVAATAVEAIIPTYLYRFCKGGQYAEALAAAVLAQA
jgi:NADH dehydrogenase